MENKIYDIKAVPFLKKIIDENGKVSYIDNFTNEELESISTKPVMLWDFGTDVYFAELPLTFRGGYINEHLFYMYEHLTDDEKVIYADRVINVKTTRPNVTMIYSVNTAKETKKRTKKK